MARWAHTDGFPPAVRRMIHARAGGRCQWIEDGRRCRQRSTTADHIVPKAEGGTDHIDNGQALCKHHHDAKTRAEQERGRLRHSRQRPPSPGGHPGMRNPGG